ncbi:MAG: VWA domain-containing protein [Anaerolineae bacterium]|nr:VWA domain-containing protein [Anaerolineae bacterium]
MSFQFANPLVLGLLAALPLLIWYLLKRRAAGPAALQYANVTPVRAGRGWKARMRPLLNVARIAALALIIFGLARPQLVQAKEIVQGQGLDIVLALDISGSMASLDFQPDNRLQAAKRVIADFIDERIYDRIGLVVFAKEAFNQSPLTTDHAVLDRLLERVELAPDLKIEDGTAIGLGIANAAHMIKDSNAKSRVVILLTDGVNNAGQIDPATAADAAQALGIKVYTIGMGRTGEVPVPVTDAFGGTQIVYQESQIDEATLKDIAAKTGGLYFRAEDTRGLQEIYARINELEKSQVEIINFAKHVELMGWLLIPALALVLGEQLLSQTLFRRIP